MTHFVMRTLGQRKRMTKTYDISRIFMSFGNQLILDTDEIERYMLISARISRMHTAYHRRRR